ncbi:MAG TPA: class I SAM-dependent methyltransferase [Thermomicrobiaceae bacterium]|nr:class I SAM-dependent methyltransferase [Thermomicrobiaceae bacterium]
MTDRAVWLAERRRITEERMNSLFAPIYDERWGSYINPTHQRIVARFLELCPADARILDAACGTGKYWPLLLTGERQVVGIDQSAGMLERARSKFPTVPTRKQGMQELDDEQAFDGIICMDALECVGPEDWPVVLANFQHALRPGGTLYVTVEMPEDDLEAVNQSAVAAGLPVVSGEYVKDGTYHYYPTTAHVWSWLTAAGFRVAEETDGDGYHHILARKR